MEMVPNGELFVGRDGGVAVVEIRRGPRNLIDFKLIRNIAQVYDELGQDPSCGAIVLASEGDAFSAGADHSRRTADVEVERANSFYDVALRLFRSPVPVVAAIHGYTAGGGLGLAMSADFRIAAPEAVFQATFVVKGLCPGFGLTRSLAFAVGQQHASFMFQTGREVGAARALEIGLADAVVPAATLRAEAIVLARQIMSNAPLAVAATRRLLRDAYASEVAVHMRLEATEQVPLFNSNDWIEGYKAFAESRPPVFTRT